jgi:hypothetical protein
MENCDEEASDAAGATNLRYRNRRYIYIME